MTPAYDHPVSATKTDEKGAPPLADSQQAAKERAFTKLQAVILSGPSARLVQANTS